MCSPGNLRASSLMTGSRGRGDTRAQRLQKDGSDVSNTVLAALTRGISSPLPACWVSNLTLHRTNILIAMMGDLCQGLSIIKGGKTSSLQHSTIAEQAMACSCRLSSCMTSSIRICLLKQHLGTSHSCKDRQWESTDTMAIHAHRVMSLDTAQENRWSMHTQGAILCQPHAGTGTTNCSQCTRRIALVFTRAPQTAFSVLK